GEFNGMEGPDLAATIISQTGDYVAIAENSGGTFSGMGGRIAPGTVASAIVSVKINNGPPEDIVLAQTPGNSEGVVFLKRKSTFDYDVSEVEGNFRGQPRSLAVGDLNKDGTDDLVGPIVGSNDFAVVLSQ